MSNVSTPEGLQYLRGFAHGLIRQAELPTRQVTVMHRDLFKRAGIPWCDGQDLQALLDTLERPQLAALIDQLRDDEQEED
jgi:hypothetical protein